MDYKTILDKAVPVVKEAAAFILSHAGKVTAADVETKSRNSLVSFVDKNAEDILVAGLRPILSGASFITEEETVERSNAEYTWIIDPLDGTTNYLQNIPFYSVSVGLLHQNEIVIGIVHDVAHQETYYAWKNGAHGAMKNKYRYPCSINYTTQ